MKRSIDRGETPGPRIHLTGRYLTGPGGSATMAQVASPEDARRIVDYWADEGVTWFKAYTTISRAALGAAIDQAHKRGLKFTGHLCSVSFREAVSLGIDTLEHGFFTNSDYVPNREPDHCSQEMRTKSAAGGHRWSGSAADDSRVIARNVAMNSTLAVYELSYPGPAAARGPRARGARAGSARGIFEHAARDVSAGRAVDDA